MSSTVGRSRWPKMHPESSRLDGPPQSGGRPNRKRNQRYIEEGRVAAKPQRNDGSIPTMAPELAAPVRPAHAVGLRTAVNSINSPRKFQESFNQAKGPGAKVDKLYSHHRASKPPPAMPLPRTSSSSSITSPFRCEGNFASASSNRSSQTVQERNISMVKNELTLRERELYNPHVMLPEGFGESLTNVESSRRIRQKTGGFQTQEQAKAAHGNANLKKLNKEHDTISGMIANRQRLKLPCANVPSGSVHQPQTLPQNRGRNGTHVTSKQGSLRMQGATGGAQSPTSSISTREMDEMLHHFILN